MKSAPVPGYVISGSFVCHIGNRIIGSPRERGTPNPDINNFIDKKVIKMVG